MSDADALTEYGFCGWLGWTIEQWGRVTHKHACPNRTDPFCQTHPDGCPDLTDGTEIGTWTEQYDDGED